MYPQIRRQRHFAGLHLFANLFELFVFSFRLVSVPDAEIHLTAAVLYMVVQEPRSRRDLRIPRICRRVRVAVRAGALEYLLDISRDRDRRLERVRRIDLGVLLVRPYKLRTPRLVRSLLSLGFFSCSEISFSK